MQHRSKIVSLTGTGIVPAFFCCYSMITNKTEKGISKMKNVIEIKDLTKNYGKSRGVSHVSFEVRKGEIFGFLGPNGAGKSTTIRSMLGFLQFESGQINILGLDSVKQHEEILKHIGYMPSEALFYPNMTVADTLKLAAGVRGCDCSSEAAKLCERLNLDTRKKISDLSLGSRKKVSIVCAMQHKPKLFIFDEPTSGLDPLMQNVFFELIEEYVQKGATCLLSTHVLSEVKNHCQRVAIMKEGNLICTDFVENLTKGNSKRVIVTCGNQQEDFLYSGNANDLIRELSGKNISDILIEEPSIEEIFMHYYERKDEQ